MIIRRYNEMRGIDWGVWGLVLLLVVAGLFVTLYRTDERISITGREWHYDVNWKYDVTTSTTKCETDKDTGITSCSTTHDTTTYTRCTDQQIGAVLPPIKPAHTCPSLWGDRASDDVYGWATYTKTDGSVHSGRFDVGMWSHITAGDPFTGTLDIFGNITGRK